MPTLNIKKKTKKSNNRQPTDMRRLRQSAYQSTEWKKLRDLYIKEHPLCENCLSEGRVTPAEDIHHKDSPFKNNTVNKHLLLDYNNLQSLCKKCHSATHNKQQGHMTAQDVLRQLEDLFNDDLPNEYFEEDDHN